MSCERLTACQCVTASHTEQSTGDAVEGEGEESYPWLAS